MHETAERLRVQALRGLSAIAGLAVLVCTGLIL